MPIPLWIYRNFSPNELENFHVSVVAEKFDKKSVYLTDARRVGIMLRKGRLTLRDHSALTRFIIEAISDKDFILRATAIGEKPYVKVGDKGAFFAQASKEEAQLFQIEVTDLGTELYLDKIRPAVFDDFYDVSVGKWSTGLSSIPLLIHFDNDLAKIWDGPKGDNSVVPQIGGTP